jgi:hypothetical protein
MTEPGFGVRRTIPAVTSPVPAVDPIRDVRRILLVLLAAVVLAGGLALTLALLHNSPSGVPVVTIFPATFSERGFVTGTVRELAAVDGAPLRRRLGRTLPVPAGTSWLVARCDTGTLTVAIGPAHSSARCTGRPVGVVVLSSRRLQQASATVSAQQRGRWGVSVYR